MYSKRRLKRALVHAYSQWNGTTCFQASGYQPNHSLTDQLATYFKKHQIIHIDNEILVTDVGFITMAIHCNLSVRFGDVCIVPGVDSEGRRGYLVLCEKRLPFHSVASTPGDAYIEAKKAQAKAQTLLAAFNTRMEMRAAVADAPWYTLVTWQDLESSGLCQWGSESFLRRNRLYTVAKNIGLPKLLLRATGVYGERLVAAKIIRIRNTVGLPAQPPAQAITPATTR